MRTALYPHLAPIVNEWNERMGLELRYPAKHEEFLKLCHAAGQLRPTPLLLRYGPGDYNCLHQDLYGELAFPIQITILPSEPGEDFSGGEFVLTEQRPRMQSRAEVVPLRQGDAVAFAVHHRPVNGTRCYYRVNMRKPMKRGALAPIPSFRAVIAMRSGALIGSNLPGGAARAKQAHES